MQNISGRTYTAIDKNNAIAWLEKYYNEPVARRAIWLWSGGAPGAVDYRENGWQRMWRKAMGAPPPHPLALLREALYDLPGDEQLLKLLGDASREHFPDGFRTAPVLVSLLESLGPRFDKKRLQTLLYSFPDGRRYDVFAAVAAAFQKRIDDVAIAPEPETETEGGITGSAAQEKSETVSPPNDPTSIERTGPHSLLEKHLLALTGEIEPPGAQGLASGIDYLLEQLLQMTAATDSPDYRSAAEALSKKIRSRIMLEETAENQMIPDNELEPLTRLAAASGDPLFIAGIAGIRRQLETLILAMEAKPMPAISETALGCLYALWGTERPAA